MPDPRLSTWTAALKRHPYMRLGLILGLLSLLAVVGDFFLGGEAERPMLLVIIAIAGMLLAAMSALAISTELQIEAVSPEPVEPELIVLSHPNEIWDNSIRVLADLVRADGTAKHAYDVSTYFNRIDYEESVAKTLESNISFDRVFCFDDGSQSASEQALRWFINRIRDDEPIEKTQIAGFEREVMNALLDSGSGTTRPITDDEFERVKSVIERLRTQRRDGNLLTYHYPHPQHTDFVLTEYIPRGGQGQKHEAVVNFKTDPRGPTYVIGFVARKTVALAYDEMFEKVLKDRASG